jgi:peptidoglycan/xylan/chitin deacetylase (PgdA/CDA1 family)
MQSALSRGKTPAGSLQLAITFDDLPAHGPLPPGATRLGVATKIIHALQDANVPPTYGFVNAAELERHPDEMAVLRAWRDAGNPLGNHTWSHMNLNQHTIEEFELEVEKNESVLEQLMDHSDWHWFRFPFLAEGETPYKHDAVRSFLVKRSYKVAAVTMSFADYAWNEPYARCQAKNNEKAVASLRETYLAAAEQNIIFYRSLSQSLFARDIPYVLLMHIGAFDAEMLPRLLDLYRSKGFVFISLPVAEKDEFYKVDTDAQSPSAPDSLEWLATERHVAMPQRTSYDQQLNAMCR